jgi:phospholipid transport system transporter-binding protein
MFQLGASLTFDNASSVLAEGLRAIDAGQAAFDFAALTVVDSSAVATMLAWQRGASAAGIAPVFGNLPENLRSLISLYDVSGLLGADAAASAGAARADLPHH